MNRNQWYWLLRKHHVVDDEINRLLDSAFSQLDPESVEIALEGLVQCCANVASQVDNTRRITGDAATPDAG